jgi:ribosomal subunit interface protein
MIIQFDTAHNVNATEKFRATLTAVLTDKLNRFNDKISRLEVHLTDENGKKEGLNDKRCLLEAHMDGVPHLVVKAHADSYDLAVDVAVDKLIASLNSTLGRHAENRQHDGNGA